MIVEVEGSPAGHTSSASTRGGWFLFRGGFEGAFEVGLFCWEVSGNCLVVGGPLVPLANLCQDDSYFGRSTFQGGLACGGRGSWWSEGGAPGCVNPVMISGGFNWTRKGLGFSDMPERQ